MKILGQLANHPKLFIESKLSLGLQEIKFPLEEPDLVLCVYNRGILQKWIKKRISNLQLPK